MNTPWYVQQNYDFFEKKINNANFLIKEHISNILKYGYTVIKKSLDDQLVSNCVNAYYSFKNIAIQKGIPSVSLAYAFEIGEAELGKFPLKL